MTDKQVNIIELAKEAGFTDHEYIEDGYVCTTAELKRFATSIAMIEAEKWKQALPIAMDAMMLQEREACAKEAETAASDDNKYDIASAIRARGEK